MIPQTDNPTISASELAGKPVSQHDERILQTQIVRLITGSGFSNVAGIAMAIIWVGLIWKDLPHEVLSVWLSVMVVLFLYRTTVHYFKLYSDTSNSFIDKYIIRRWYMVCTAERVGDCRRLYNRCDNRADLRLQGHHTAAR